MAGPPSWPGTRGRTVSRSPAMVDWRGRRGCVPRRERSSVRAVALAPDGSLLLVDPGAHQVRRVGPVLPGYAATTLTIAAEDGSEVYLFDPAGRAPGSPGGPPRHA